jgi:TonB family protein
VAWEQVDGNDELHVSALRGMIMVNRCVWLGAILGFLLFPASALPAEEMTIRVHLFKGDWAEGNPGLKEVTVMTAATHPAIEPLKAKIRAPEEAQKTAVAAALMDMLELKTVDHLLSFSKPWSGKDTRLGEAMTLGRTTFLFNFVPKRHSPQKVALSTSLFRSKTPTEAGPADDRATKELLDAFAAGKTGAGMDKILDVGLELEIGDPAVVVVPTEGGAYFMMIALTVGAKSPGQVEFAGGPKVLHQVIPSYPDELRRKGIEGQVELQVGIDEEGNVGGVRILKSLNPYLDNSAVHALKQWKYEPVLRDGVPVPAVITLTVNFTREAYRQAEEAAAKGQAAQAAGRKATSQAALPGILAKCADYCDKLKGAALDYICEETIRDVNFNLPTGEELRKQSSIVLSMVNGTGSVSQLGISRLPFPNPERAERNEYLCDYLFVKKAEGIQDRRIILKENGRPLPDRTKILEERRFTTLTPFLAPIRLLGRDRQPLFDYKLLKGDTVKGKEVWVIEVVPKAGNAAGVEYAKAWVEKKIGQVVKAEMTGLPYEGYESVITELIQYNAPAKFAATYSYSVEKNGLAFPSEARIRVNYAFPGITPERFTIERIRTDLKYDKYKFFTVETEGTVKK